MGSRHNTIKLTKLIENYINDTDSSARVKLSNMVLYGEDIADALDNMNVETSRQKYLKLEEDYEQLNEEHKELEKEHKKLDQDYQELKKNNDSQELVNNLESLIKGKEGPFIEEISYLIKGTKQD
jgi:t-SNARE complex subunit (syntaxin)